MIAKSVRGYDVVALSPAEMVDAYSRWFSVYGLFDYVDDLLPVEQAGHLAVEIEGGQNARLTVHNLHLVLSLL